MRVALAQLRPAVGLPKTNVAALETVLDAHPDVDRVICPELFIGGYTTNDHGQLGLPKDDGLIQRLAARPARHQTALIVGFSERGETGPANSALCIDGSGNVVGCYRKTHLFRSESETFTPGEELYVVTLAGTRIGLMICFDIEFPEVDRSLAEAGADVLISLSANMTPFGPDHRLFVQSRALENWLPHIYFNQVGHGEKFLFAGESCVADAAGVIMTQCPPHAEAVAVTEVALSADTRTRPDYLTLRRGPPPVILQK